MWGVNPVLKTQVCGGEQFGLCSPPWGGILGGKYQFPPRIWPFWVVPPQKLTILGCSPPEPAGGSKPQVCGGEQIWTLLPPVGRSPGGEIICSPPWGETPGGESKKCSPPRSGG